MFKVILVIALLFSPVQPACAHDPGLSRNRVQLFATDMAVQMSFSRDDIEILAPMDTNHDGVVTAVEFSEARNRLQSIIADGIHILDSTEIRGPEAIDIEQTSGDAVNVNLRYLHPGSSEIRIHIPLISQLARGHRQYLTLQDENGVQLAQHVLNAASAPLLLREAESGSFGVFREYLLEGIWHIWAGLDHILFLLTLLLPAVLVYRNAHWQSRSNLRPAVVDTLRIVTAFTIAHSITLGLAALNIVSLPTRLVETVIALSVLIVAANNLRPFFPASRWLLAFVFGLVHGFGFASVLADIGLPGNALIVSLLGFNLGVEAGQLAIVVLVFPVAALVRHTRLYRTWMFSGGSTVAALIAMVWIYERIFDDQLLGF